MVLYIFNKFIIYNKFFYISFVFLWYRKKIYIIKIKVRFINYICILNKKIQLKLF